MLLLFQATATQVADSTQVVADKLMKEAIANADGLDKLSLIKDICRKNEYSRLSIFRNPVHAVKIFFSIRMNWKRYTLCEKHWALLRITTAIWNRSLTCSGEQKITKNLLRPLKKSSFIKNCLHFVSKRGTIRKPILRNDTFFSKIEVVR